ncbi:nuclear transport factor 2 family protein [Tabrizicola sp. BL-A-41-H6]|uniref:nuclear transport factor 2 family protein n=1 Tax=Tabrizicola sp. BL-A-41-H6 TaxID=3421107 RepID=UPI003D67B09B
MSNDAFTAQGSRPTCVDRHEIEDVLTDYCHHLDRMDLSALAGLFTHDCVVIYGPEPHLTACGRAALAASLARMWRWKRTAHHLSNLRICALTSDAARAESYVLAWHERPDGQTATLYGRYLDLLTRTPDGWRIQERRMDMNGADQGFRVAIPQAIRAAPPPGWRPPEGIDGAPPDQDRPAAI